MSFFYITHIMIGKTWKSTNLIFYKLNIYSESFYMGDLVLSTVPRAIITRLKDILSKIKRAKLNMACACVCVCVCTCDRTPFMIRPEWWNITWKSSPFYLFAWKIWNRNMLRIYLLCFLYQENCREHPKDNKNTA